jgi:hypothetical protein
MLQDFHSALVGDYIAWLVFRVAIFSILFTASVLG